MKLPLDRFRYPLLWLSMIAVQKNTKKCLSDLGAGAFRPILASGGSQALACGDPRRRRATAALMLGAALIAYRRDTALLLANTAALL